MNKRTRQRVKNIEYPFPIYCYRTASRYFPAYCGYADGIDYGIYITVNMEQLLKTYMLTVSQIYSIEIINSIERDIELEVWTNENTQKIASGMSENSEYAVDFLKIYKMGFRDFSVRPANKNDCVIFNDLKIRMYTASGEIAVNSPYSFCLCLSGYVAFNGEPARMGNDGYVKFFTWSAFDINKLYDAEGISPDDVRSVSVKLKGSKSQSFEIWYNYGWTKLGEYKSVNGVYTVPISDIVKLGYKDFSITSSTSYDTFSEDVTVEIALKTDPLPDEKNISYGNNAAQRFDIYFPKTAAPKGGYPLLITIHGGNWYNNYPSNPYSTKEYYDYMTDDILDNDIIQASPGYRGINDGADCEDMLNDIQSVIKYILNKYGDYIDKSRIGLLGWSAGGHLSLLYAYRRNNDETPIKTVISEAGPVEIIVDFFNDAQFQQDTLQLCGNLTENEISPLNYANGNVETHLFYGYGIEIQYANTHYNGLDGDGTVPISPVEDLNYKITDTCSLNKFKDLEHDYFRVEYENDKDGYKQKLLNAIKSLKN